MTEHYDVIVVGSGAGGGTLTHALAPTGARILLLERGGWLPREPENWSPAAVWADADITVAGTAITAAQDAPSRTREKRTTHSRNHAIVAG